MLVTAKPPAWRDALVQWRDLPPALGEPHEGFFYPDPLGFWAEVRRWAAVLVRRGDPSLGLADALALSACVHLGEGAATLSSVLDLARPKVVLFLDDASLTLAGRQPTGRVAHHVPDPHRAGKTYDGFWGTDADGTVIGKAPQHPSAHRFYRGDDMDGFLAAVPLGPGYLASDG